MRKSASNFVDIIKQLFGRFKEDDVSALSAQLTYYLILSVFPFLLFSLNILSFTSIPISVFIENVTAFMPGDIGVLIKDIVQETLSARSTALLSIGALATVWSASKGINAIRKGLNKAYGADETRSYWKTRVISLLFTIGLALVLVTTVVSLIFGRVIIEEVFDYLKVSHTFNIFWQFIRFIVPLGVLILVFSLLYKYLPNQKIRLKRAMPGAIFTTTGWIVISAAFSFYVNSFANYSKVYGSIGAIIILLIWLYLSSIIILLGGEINAIVDNFRSDRNHMEDST